MSANLNEEINRAFDLEEAGHFLEAVSLCRKCAQDFPEYAQDIRLEIAKMHCRNGKEKAAFLLFLELYHESDRREILDLMLEIYYEGSREEYERQYEQNLAHMEKYTHFYGSMPDIGTPDKEGIRYLPLYMGEQALWYYDSAEGRLKVAIRPIIDMGNLKSSTYLSNDLLWMEDILNLEQHTRMQHPFMDMEHSLLLVYSRETWELLQQLWDLKDLLELDRIVFYEDADFLETSFLRDGVGMPKELFLHSGTEGKLARKIHEICRAYEEEYKRHRQEAIQYYREKDNEIMGRIREGAPRILFMTSRFTTVLQYHTKACQCAADRLGLETRLMIEKDRLGIGKTPLEVLRTINTFRPDIFFVIDHFRFENTWADGLDNLVFLCWVQDAMPDIFNAASPAKLKKRDIILNHGITWRKFFSFGYDKRKIIDAPIPADSHIYRRYSLSREERDKYACDLCFVCHASDVDIWIEDNLKGIEGFAAGFMRELYKGYQRRVYESGQCLYGEESFQEYVRDVFGLAGISIAGELLDDIAAGMHMWLNQRVFRQALVDWLLDAGYTNIKLWGNGWQADSKYAAYAMGPAENGETLSKIYQASKIVVGNNVNTTAAARAWESMLSGAFYLSNYIPPQTDDVDIRTIMREGEELAMFRDREDLLAKVAYYLTHEDERLRMLEIGHNAALERMTFDGLMRKVLRELPEKLEV